MILFLDLCESGWKHFQGNCYYRSENTVDYGETYNECSKLEATEFSISTQDDNDFIQG